MFHLSENFKLQTIIQHSAFNRTKCISFFSWHSIVWTPNRFYQQRSINRVRFCCLATVIEGKRLFPRLRIFQLIFSHDTWISMVNKLAIELRDCWKFISFCFIFSLHVFRSSYVIVKISKSVSSIPVMFYILTSKAG